MKIQQMADLSGLTTKTIRFYEQKGIISSPSRESNGYRVYARMHLDELILIKRARLVGFSLEECKHLLLLSKDKQRKSCDVKAHALTKLEEIDLKINQLQEIKAVLIDWVAACPGNQESNCPILEGLSKEK